MTSAFTGTLGFTSEVHVTDEEFLQLRNLIYEQSGIYIPDNRKYLVENRLANRIRDLNLKTYGEYYYYLRYDQGRASEMKRLFEVITTNETSFYRNPPQLEVFQETILPLVFKEVRDSGSKRLRIWSAGCSTGEEPYTLAIILSEALGAEFSAWDLRITANDLSEKVLQTARRGIYSQYALRTTPPEIVEKYFRSEGERFHLDEKIKKCVSFESLNLNDRLKLKQIEKSQVVFCRNVIIYFNNEMKEKVVSAFYDNLVSGGYLFIGHSESLHNISRTFRPTHHPGTIVYQKEG